MNIDNILKNSPNSLIMKEKRVFYRKLMSNIMLNKEERCLELINLLITNNLCAISREEELACLRPWGFTLLEATETMGMTKIVNALKNISYITSVGEPMINYSRTHDEVF